MTASLTVANTIRQQLGNRFVVMTGACNWLGDARSLSFKIGRNSRGVTHVRVTLNDADLYDIEFIKARAGESNVICEAGDVYAEDLAENIGCNTRMAVTL
ncbi:MAG TPA: hypothetical protein VF681_09605 [Abditibacteriaceae bacterium]